MNDYYERYSDNGEKKQRKNYISTEENAATYDEGVQPKQIEGTAKLKVCKKCGAIYSLKHRKCENCEERLSEPMSPEDAEKMSNEILGLKGISAGGAVNRKLEAGLRNTCIALAVVAVLLSVAACVLARLIGVENPVNDIADRSCTTVLAVVNVVIMSQIVFFFVSPEKARKLMVKSMTRRQRHRYEFRQHIVNDVNTSLVGPAIVFMIYPVISIVVSIISIVTIINEAYHLF